MSNASANSSKTSKEVENKNRIKFKVVGGLYSAVEKGKEYALEMNPEYVLDFSVEMVDLGIKAGSYTVKGINKVDDLTGVVLNKQSVKKVIKTKKSIESKEK